MRRVEVRWEDSAIADNAGWTETADIRQISEEVLTNGLQTVGLLVLDEERYVTVCSSWNPTAEAGHGCVMIPRSAIRKMKTI